MDLTKIGKLIYTLRQNEGWTQKQLAEKMNISDRTVSKWERGAGLPDVALLNELSKIFSVNIEKILSGELSLGEEQGGNMKNISFYLCPQCGDIITSTGSGDITCCGRKITPMVAQPAPAEHKLKVQEIETDFFVSFEHPMSKEDHLAFAALVSWDRYNFVRLYPESFPEFRIQQLNKKAKLYYGDNQGHLWFTEV